MNAPAAVDSIVRAAGRAVVARTFDVPVPRDALAWFAAAHARFGEAVYLESPDAGTLRLCAGAADTGDAPVVHDGDAAALVRIGGAAFDPSGAVDPLWRGFPARRLVLPRIALEIAGDTARATLAAAVEPGTGPFVALNDLKAALHELSAGVRPNAPPRVRAMATVARPARWTAAVAATAAELRTGAACKVVLARRVQTTLDGTPDVLGALERLRATAPTSCVFAFARGERVFLGATPERLVRVQAGRFEIDALAGTAPRGADAAHDEALARALFASAKEREEHAIVVEWLRAALADVSDEVVVAPGPRLRVLAGVQHLSTAVWGRTARPVLDLVARLHPTPAVAGAPRAAALAVIRAREGFDRGWYAGPIGWSDAAGEGEFFVAIRSAVLAPGSATLFAGAGIVRDSDPATELAETELKLRTMRDALGLEA